MNLTTSVRPLDPDARSLSSWHAAAIYVSAAIAWTWPLAPNITTSIAWDLGDPMLVAWILGWVNDSVLALARGDAGRFLALWDPPIFYPEPLALAYSEHFIPQALLVLPLYAITGNVILCYNIAVLTTFVLSALGMFLLTRELTGSALAGLLAGAVFGFTPYRVDQLSHLQILSSQWLPFALYGFRRYFTTLRVRPLVWGSMALVLSNLSSGYYLLYFAPFVVVYVLIEMWSRGFLRRPRIWLQLLAAGGGMALLTLPFLLPYLAARVAGAEARSYTSIREFSADVYGYVTGSAYIPWYRDTLDGLRDMPENATFPGLVAVIIALATLGVLAADGRRRWVSSAAPPGRRAILWPLLGLAAVGAVTMLWIAATGGRIFQIGGVEVRLRNFTRLTIYTAVAAGAAAGVSPRLRAALRGRAGSLAGPALLLAFAAFMLSLGPRMESGSRFIGHGPYALLLSVQGFDGVRVPARFAMIVVFWMAVAGAYAAARFGRRRWRAVVICMLVVTAIVESRPWPFSLARPFTERSVASLSMAHRLKAAAPLYERLRALPHGVLLELPFGRAGWDVQYMHLQRRHEWPLVNGYSGYFPPSWTRASMVEDALESVDRPWWALERSGASHVIVHEWAFSSPDRGKRVSQWLRENGAAELASTGDDTLFRLPGGIRHR